MYGYSGLHRLRRIGAYLALGRPMPPPGDHDAAEDPVLQDYFNRFLAGERLKYEHLIVHSDAEGFYVPVDFERPIVVDDGVPLAGGMLGSTQRLLAECLELADALGVPAGMKAESSLRFNFFRDVIRGGEKWQPYASETYTCLQLIEACGASL